MLLDHSGTQAIIKANKEKKKLSNSETDDFDSKRIDY